MSRIETLSEEQVARFPEFVEKWTRIGLSTEPADWDKFDRGITQAYIAAKLKVPDRRFRVASPMGGAILCTLLKNPPPALRSAAAAATTTTGASVGASVGDSVRASVGDSVWDSVWDSVRDSVGASVWASVRDSVWASVRDSVWDSVGDSVGDSVRASVWASVRDSVWASVWDSVGASVWDSVRASVGDSVWDSVWDSVGDSVGASVRASVWASVRDSVGDSVGEAAYGQHDANWLGFYDYFNRVCGLKEQTEKLTGMWAISEAGGWWWPYQHAVVLSDRPSALHRDDRGRLHNESGMALAYRDGWGIYAIGGVRLDEQIVMAPKTQKVAQIRDEKNAEIKRIRIERFGWDDYLKAIDAKVIDHRHNPMENTSEALVRAADGMTVLLPTCKTGRMFALEVPPEIRTCEAAQTYLHSGSSVDAMIGKTRVIGRS